MSLHCYILRDASGSILALHTERMFIERHFFQMLTPGLAIWKLSINQESGLTETYALLLTYETTGQ